MNRRMKVLAIVVLAVLLGSILAIEVQAGIIITDWPHIRKPYDFVWACVVNHHPFDTYEILVTIYDDTHQVVTSLYVHVSPDDSWSEESEGWCSEVGGVTRATFEQVDGEATHDWYAGCMWRNPCDGSPFAHVYLPMLGT